MSLVRAFGKLIVSAVPEDRPSLVVALAARLAQLGVGLVAPTTNGNGGRATTEVEMPSPFLSTAEAGVYLGLSPRTLERPGAKRYIQRIGA